MSRRSLIICASVLAAMAVVIGLSIAFLYSGSDDDTADARAAILSDAQYRAFGVVPSDAMLVCSFSSADKASAKVVSAFSDVSDLLDGLKKEGLAQILQGPMTLSLHYSGRVNVLYVFDLRGVSETVAQSAQSYLQKENFHLEKVSDLMLISTSASLVKSGVRHFEQGLCVLDAPGFVQAVKSIGTDDLMLVSNVQARHLIKPSFSSAIFKYAGFFETFAEWTAVNVSATDDAPVHLLGKILDYDELGKFLNVFDRCQPQVSGISTVLPSYTVFAGSLQISDVSAYVEGYEKYQDSKQQLQAYRIEQQALADAAGISPKEFFAKIAVKEVGTASFVVGSKLESINLMKVGKEDLPLIFNNPSVTSLERYSPSVNEWNYGDFAASVFGDLYRLDEETHFTYIGGWIISGSSRAVDEYVSKGAYGYTLDQYMTHAGKHDLLAAAPALFVGYYSLTEKGNRLSDYLKSDFNKAIKKYIDGASYAPVILTVGKAGGEMTVSCDIYDLSLKRTKAPEYDRDTTVDVPAGPFNVKNSHTGKNNSFYQNSSLAVCLRDEKGKDLWGVPLGKPICGTAHNVDYFANGKLQIIFGAGSQIYIIDRLGRYVSGFPLDLKKEIAVGPDVYDFSGARKYNIMVLHKDNTIQMYNLKGEVPKAWKGITVPQETIKGLPERLTVKGSDFWVVRTSVQTLIFPFYGGEPVTDFSGDRKIRPDSKIVLDGNSVNVSCYDGRTRSVKLK